MRIELILLAFDGRPNLTKIYPLTVRVSFALEKKDHPPFPLKEPIGLTGETLRYINPWRVAREIKIGRQISHYV